MYAPDALRSAMMQLALLAMPAAWAGGMAPPLRSSTVRATHRASPLFAGAFDEAARDPLSSGEEPGELFGPWNLRCTLSGYERMWVELVEGGEVTCSSRVGTGRSWGASRQRGCWQLRFVLLDKLRRPVAFEGEVGEDDALGTTIRGVIRGAPTRGKASAAEVSRGIVIGEFEGTKA